MGGTRPAKGAARNKTAKASAVQVVSVAKTPRQQQDSRVSRRSELAASVRKSRLCSLSLAGRGLG